MQRNYRHAAFRVLEALGELQEVVDYRYYYLHREDVAGAESDSRLSGFGNLNMVRDLTQVMPPPAPEAGEHLQQTWHENFRLLDDLRADGGHTAAAATAEEKLTAAINEAREAVLQVIRELE